jgi:hypothetical protein
MVEISIVAASRSHACPESGVGPFTIGVACDAMLATFTDVNITVNPSGLWVAPGRVLVKLSGQQNLAILRFRSKAYTKRILAVAAERQYPTCTGPGVDVATYQAVSTL